MEYGQEFIVRRRAEKLMAYFVIKCDIADRLATLQDLHDYDPDDQHSTEERAKLTAMISFTNRQIATLRVDSVD